ncbi:MAG: hypothetical protein ACI9MC_001775 [Kiritimatiellia bacterium]|jgi:hypothetical protein
MSALVSPRGRECLSGKDRLDHATHPLGLGDPCPSCSESLPVGWPHAPCEVCGFRSDVADSQPVAWALVLCSIASMTTASSAFFFGVATVGLDSVGLPVLLGSAGATLLLATLVSSFSAAKVARLPPLLTLRSVGLTMIGPAVPFVGLLLGPVMAWFYFVDREPSAPADTRRRDQRQSNPRGIGWPLAILHLFAGPFFLAVLGAVSNTPLWELASTLFGD